jgi:hypothetical protein
LGLPIIAWRATVPKMPDQAPATIDKPKAQGLFRLSSEALKPPQRCVSVFTAEELLRLRGVFRPLAERYRRYARTAYIVLAISFACILSGMGFPKTMFPWFAGGFFICWLTLLFLACLSPNLDCPACHNRLERGFGPFCPECGAQALRPGRWFRAPMCSSCGRAMRRGKSRGYRIRACTHCGVMLDDKGL